MGWTLVADGNRNPPDPIRLRAGSRRDDRAWHPDKATRGEWSRKTKAKVKKTLLVALLVVGVFALAGAMPASAQSLSKVNVPFQFVVGDSVLPAGNYTVTSLAHNPDVVAIQSADGKSVATVLVTPSGELTKQPHATFSFAKIGGRYFLSAVSVPGAGTRTLLLPKSRVAAMLAKLNGTKVPTGPAL